MGLWSEVRYYPMNVFDQAARYTYISSVGVDVMSVLRAKHVPSTPYVARTCTEDGIS